MTITLDLTAEQEARLLEKASRAGVDPANYIRRFIESETEISGEPVAEGARTGAELLAALDAVDLPYGYGDPSIDFPELARRLRKQAETRDWS